MNHQNRRTALKTVALAAGAFLSTEALALETKTSKLRPRTIPGSWKFSDQPCAIFQQGPVLLLVNETGTLATGQFISSDTFKIIKGEGWGIGMTGQLIENGKRIKWSDGAHWVQA
ncbi:MAG: hypothetical protein K0Q55_1471 [Verrucomicrobia bacterium]|jgi:hypothetical protein|nr:hypothetical protein [Verrucomicrobiota bacterium]